MNRASAQRAGGMTIRRRLLLILIGPLALLLAIGVVLDYAAGVIPLRAAFDQALVNETLAAAAQLRTRAGGTVEFDLPPQAIEMLRADKYDTVYYLVLGPHDEYVAGDAGLPSAAPDHENPTFLDAQFKGSAIRGVTYPHPTIRLSLAPQFAQRHLPEMGVYDGLAKHDQVQRPQELITRYVLAEKARDTDI